MYFVIFCLFSMFFSFSILLNTCSYHHRETSKETRCLCSRIAFLHSHKRIPLIWLQITRFFLFFFYLPLPLLLSLFKLIKNGGFFLEKKISNGCGNFLNEELLFFHMSLPVRGGILREVALLFRFQYLFEFCNMNNPVTHPFVS